MRTFTVVVVALALAALPCFGRSMGLPNELVNGSWQTGDDSGWVPAGGGVVDLNSWFGNPGPAPGETDAYGWGLASSWATADGSISQDVFVPAGEYEVDLSGWLQAKDGWGFESWIELQLTIDGQVVDSQRVAASGADTGWVYVEMRWQGWVNEKKDVHLVAHTDGREAGPANFPWGIVYADGIDLEERLVPEPASLALLAWGGLVLTARRRH